MDKEEKRCPYCGAELKNDPKFCPVCGRVLKTEDIGKDEEEQGQ